MILEEPKKYRPWGLFDGAKYGRNLSCGGGFVLYLSNQHYFKASMGLGMGSNILEKILSYHPLMDFVHEKGCDKLQVFGDSLLVIDWVNYI